MIGLRGFRDRDRDLLAQVWRGDDLVTRADGPAWPLDLPDPGPRSILLVAPGVGVVHLGDVEQVHRRARLTVAAAEAADCAGLLSAALAAADARLHLHRVYGYLPPGDPAEDVATEQGFVAELTIPEHGLRDGMPVPRSVWGWVA